MLLLLNLSFTNMHKIEILYTLDEITDVAKKFLSFTIGYKILTFTGDLGSGKTTFINALCRQLVVSDPVTSPTYSLIQEYSLMNSGIIYHMDFYRLNSLEEAIDAGAEECISSGEICIIEWPTIINKLLPGDIVESNISIITEYQRKLVVQLP